jgi:hypothetical protein
VGAADSTYERADPDGHRAAMGAVILNRHSAERRAVTHSYPRLARLPQAMHGDNSVVTLKTPFYKYRPQAINSMGPLTWWLGYPPNSSTKVLMKLGLQSG